MRILCSLLAIIFVVISGCSTIYFQRDGVLRNAVDSGEWHHGGILRLVEFSPPVNLKERCEGRDWETVKVERTFLNWFASNATYNLYDPWEVSYKCK